ncbi:hypothetical protein D3C72_1369660 [compost metagenome]
MQGEIFPLHRAAVFQHRAAERHVAFAEQLPTVIQRLRRHVRRAFAHQRPV